MGKTCILLGFTVGNRSSMLASCSITVWRILANIFGGSLTEHWLLDWALANVQLSCVELLKFLFFLSWSKRELCIALYGFFQINPIVFKPLFSPLYFVLGLDISKPFTLTYCPWIGIYSNLILINWLDSAALIYLDNYLNFEASNLCFRNSWYRWYLAQSLSSMFPTRTTYLPELNVSHLAPTGGKFFKCVMFLVNMINFVNFSV